MAGFLLLWGATKAKSIISCLFIIIQYRFAALFSYRSHFIGSTITSGEFMEFWGADNNRRWHSVRLNHKNFSLRSDRNAAVLFSNQFLRAAHCQTSLLSFYRPASNGISALIGKLFFDSTCRQFSPSDAKSKEIYSRVEMKGSIGSALICFQI